MSFWIVNGLGVNVQNINQAVLLLTYTGNNAGMADYNGKVCE